MKFAQAESDYSPPLGKHMTQLPFVLKIQRILLFSQRLLHKNISHHNRYSERVLTDSFPDSEGMQVAHTHRGMNEKVSYL